MTDMDHLEALQQDEVFKHFLALTKIPRESGNEKAVSDYCVQFANQLGLEVIQEPSMNVIIRKPASTGYETRPTVILQGHLDMVCVKRDDYAFDFNTQAIPLVLDGDTLKTEGTTLGADNGIAVAMIMAILESKTIKHPPIQALFTVEEETGMGGVMSLEPSNLSGDMLINIDAEEEGVILASCAGGVNNILEWPIKWQKSTMTEAFLLKIQGLKGGHSGIEIDKMRANAIKLAGRTLQTLMKTTSFELASVKGGEKMNAIAKFAQMTLLVNPEAVSTLQDTISKLSQQFRGEHLGADADVQMMLVKAEVPEMCFDSETTKAVAEGLCLMPFGVQSMSSTIAGLVESSSNLGVLTTEEEIVKLTNSVRSSIVSLKDEISGRAAMIASLTGAKWYQISDYPAWAYREISPLRDLMTSVYEKRFEEPLKVDAIHAGLECGFLSEKLGDIDMIAMGPNMHDVHTPFESVSVSSVQRVFSFLCDVLENI
jgi:dipeptidase D